MIKELEAHELDGLITFNHHPVALFIYTPLCGTCKVARDMLNIVDHTLSNINVYSININMLPQVAQQWHIQSVPCVAILHRGRVVKKKYAMVSVSDLYGMLKPLQKINGHLDHGTI